MLSSDQCRQNAEYYFQLAEHTRAGKRKRDLSRLAVDWLRLAELTRRQENLTRNGQVSLTSVAA
jgi:hypothetical protein